MKKFIIPVLSLALLLSLLSGCASQNGDTPDTGSIADDEMFTDRDREIGYDLSKCVSITLSDSGSECDSGAVSIDGSVVTITGEGYYLLSGSLSEGQLVVDATSSDKIQLIFDGVSISNSSGAAVYIKQADKVFLTTANGSENTLSVTGDYVQTDDNNVDAAIFSKDDLTLNGAGKLTISAQYGHGVVTKDDLAITSGSYEVTAAKTALSGKQSVRIGGGVIDLTAGVDGIHSEDADDDTLGFIYIADGDLTISCESDGMDAMTRLLIVGGSMSISAGDDALHCDAATVISGGDIDISSSYEGIEGKTVEISGGTISLVASDDGINAAGGGDQSGFAAFGGGQDRFADTGDVYILISGGTLDIDASGDGIDSNGDLTITGGYITLSGPTNDGNGALDYGEGCTATISGGTLLGSGSSGMAEGFSDTSTQCSVLYALSSSFEGGTEVVIKDSSGKLLASFAPKKSFSCLNISLPELEENGSYTISVGGTDYEFTLEGTVFSNGTGFGGQFGGFKGGRGDMTMPDGEMPTMPDGEMPTMPDGQTPPQMPSGGNKPTQGGATGTSDGQTTGGTV